jgi:NADPH2:quinone reductase
MRAVQVKGFGDVDQLELSSCRIRSRRRDRCVSRRSERFELRRCHAARGLYPGGPKPPFISGLEAAGVVEAGEGLPLGARVMAVSPVVVMRSVCALVRRRACPFPSRCLSSRPAAFPVQYLTAYHALTTVRQSCQW